MASLIYVNCVRPGDGFGHSDYAPGWVPAPRAGGTVPLAKPSVYTLPEMVTHPHLLSAWGLWDASLGRAIPSSTSPQPERIFRRVVFRGWTFLGAWDRSEDQRYGSSCTIAEEGIFSGEDVLAHVYANFPGLLQRMTKHAGLLEVIDHVVWP